MIASGVSLRRSVSPGWPFCPPGFLPDGSRKLLTRGGFLSPSLDGGLPLLLLFSPRRRSNSAICARNAAISAACPACCASSSAMRSSFESWPRAVRSTDSFESTRRSHVNRILHPCPASRHNTRTPACDRVSWTVGLGTWAVTGRLTMGPAVRRRRYLPHRRSGGARPVLSWPYSGVGYLRRGRRRLHTRYAFYARFRHGALRFSRRRRTRAVAYDRAHPG